MSIRLPPPSVPELKARFASFCHRHDIQRLEVFGSVADGRADEESDIDLLVTLRAEPPVSVSELLEMVGEAEEIIGAPIDFVLRSDLEREGSARSEHILRGAVCIYGR